jgi:pimeloyl-ACP methyl ester carboxylesterase
MESFVHLRKGRIPRRLHADLDGLKDDELGRGGFTGRTANMYRRHDPTAYRSVGPLRPIDVLTGELKPSDATDANSGPLLLFANPDYRISLSRRGEPPYSEEFLGRYRQAQIDRNRRITAWVKQKLADLEAAGHPNDEFGFVVHGTMADPRWLDPSVDPNERTPGTCYLGDPQVVNMSPVGLARFSTLRSWLSQWSYDDAHGDGVACGRDIAVPALVIGNLADDACTPSHTRRLFEAIGHPEKEMHEIPGATHYYVGPDQRDKLRQAVDIVTDWLVRNDFARKE